MQGLMMDVPLTILGILRHAQQHHGEQEIVSITADHPRHRCTYRQAFARAGALANALARLELPAGARVATLAWNDYRHFELFYAVSCSGLVLHTVNPRLLPEQIAWILNDGGASVLFAATEFAPLLAKITPHLVHVRSIVFMTGAAHMPAASPAPLLADPKCYETLVEGESPVFGWPELDERSASSLCYTSGTTGNPKGVVTHHRGAYLNALGNIVTWAMPRFPVYLWTLPMFHCNGWCFPWTLAAVAGTSICLRRVEAATVFDLIRRHKVTHFCGAPVVHNMLINAPAEQRQGITHRVSAMIAGAAPPRTVIEGMERMGVDLTHVYGLTEVYGPASVCAKQPEWDALPPGERAEKNGRQGVRYLLQENMAVLDPDGLRPVPRDGKTMGEIFFRGNITMKGYLKNPQATAEAFEGGWFHTGDLAVVEADGYVKIKDRSKDIIISGGENVSTIEVEDVLYSHPLVLEAAVVARPDEKWGETPCAFVTLRAGAEVVTEADLIAFCREHLAHFKCPRKVVFGPLPKTSTGKIQKNVLREQAKSV